MCPSYGHRNSLQTCNISCTLVGHKLVDHPCRRYYNYIFILEVKHGFSRLGRDNCQARTYKCWDLVRLILEVWRFGSYGWDLFRTMICLFLLRAYNLKLKPVQEIQHIMSRLIPNIVIYLRNLYLRYSCCYSRRVQTGHCWFLVFLIWQVIYCIWCFERRFNYFNHSRNIADGNLSDNVLKWPCPASMYVLMIIQSQGCEITW